MSMSRWARLPLLCLALWACESTSDSTEADAAADTMTPEQEHDFIAHLDDCRSCGQELQQHAAVEARWTEVRTLLSVESSS